MSENPPQPKSSKESTMPGTGMKTEPGADGSSVDVQLRKQGVELDKLQIEIQELRAWRLKWISNLFISLLGPIGAAIAFIAGLYFSHATERKTNADTQFAQTLQLVSSSDVPMRMAGFIGLGRFMRISPSEGILPSRFTPNWLSNLFDYNGETSAEKDRYEESVGLMVARLPVEDDPSILLLMNEKLKQNQSVALPLLLNANRQAAGSFARCAGTYSALGILRILKKTSVPAEDDPKLPEARESAVQALIDGILRAGSPFGNQQGVNNIFQPRPFLQLRGYGFRAKFHQEERRDLFAFESKELNPRKAVPSLDELDKAMKDAVNAAVYLRKTSDLLAEFANEGSWDAISAKDLQGNAIVSGEIAGDKVEILRVRGAYVQSSPEVSPNLPPL